MDLTANSITKFHYETDYGFTADSWFKFTKHKNDTWPSCASCVDLKSAMKKATYKCMIGVHAGVLAGSEGSDLLISIDGPDKWRMSTLLLQLRWEDNRIYADGGRIDTLVRKRLFEEVRQLSYGACDQSCATCTLAYGALIGADYLRRTPLLIDIMMVIDGPQNPRQLSRKRIPKSLAVGEPVPVSLQYIICCPCLSALIVHWLRTAYNRTYSRASAPTEKRIDRESNSEFPGWRAGALATTPT
ncbi:hypothetical protein CLF_102910 [Clonorchis sinensis]|uniref:Uncharacterized protein n=1 Tax=Clonorchis sinensis TaxID=79923 RepID=G7Y8R3_CLOSI|nr:hypothetical protein CLF_102910 [Clonorchis sinensis]